MAKQISVLGAGSWGTALATLLANNGHSTLLWARNESQVKSMQDSHENRRYLPDLTLPTTLDFTADLQLALNHAEVIVLATPSHSFRSFIQQLKPWIDNSHPLIWACKGLEKGTANLCHQVAMDELGNLDNVGVISGPSFAKEVVQGLPTAVTVAAENKAYASRAASWFQGDNFRAYANTDMIGVEIGGALKNVFAIAAGISDGLGFGANSRAALITRGLAELMRLGVQLGARKETLMGLSGMGDLILTCTDDLSRNRRFGLALAKGLTTEQAMDTIGQAVEGASSSIEAYNLAHREQVDMPIVSEVFAVINDNKKPIDAVRSLLARAPTSEMR